MSDERLDKLGDYFIHFAVKERFGYTFTQFIEMVETGRWVDPVIETELPYQTKGIELPLHK
jgi:hypothetical protein